MIVRDLLVVLVVLVRVLVIVVVGFAQTELTQGSPPEQALPHTPQFLFCGYGNPIMSKLSASRRYYNSHRSQIGCCRCTRNRIACNRSSGPTFSTAAR